MIPTIARHLFDLFADIDDCFELLTFTIQLCQPVVEVFQM